MATYLEAAGSPEALLVRTLPKVAWQLDGWCLGSATLGRCLTFASDFPSQSHPYLSSTLSTIATL